MKQIASDEKETPWVEFYKKVPLKVFAIFSGKHLCMCWSLILLKLQKETPTQVSPVNIAKFLRMPILKNICEWLKLINFFFPFAFFKGVGH